MASDSSEIDAALIAKLTADATLSELLPGGWFADVAPNNMASAFGIISVVIGADEPMFDATAFEECLYLIKAVDNVTSGATVKSAAFRIHQLLQLQPLTVTGYTHMLTRRKERVRYTEVDDINPDIRWQHRGGRYEVFVSPT